MKPDQWKKLLYENKLKEAQKADDDDLEIADDALLEIESDVKLILRNIADARKAINKGMLPGLGNKKNIVGLAKRVLEYAKDL